MARGRANLKLAAARPTPYHRPTVDLTIILGNKNYSSWSPRAWLAAAETEPPVREPGRNSWGS